MTIVYHPRYMEHVQGNMRHPESPERLRRLLAKLESHGLDRNLMEPQPATGEELAMVHDPAYVKEIREHPVGAYDPDTYIRPETYEIALLAAGGALLAAGVAYEEKRTVFCTPRPPGHHAGVNYAKGFCYFDNIALGAQRLVREHGARVAIVDIDVHHGNGTEEIFYHRDDVLYLSTHQQWIFPGTGAVNDTGRGDGKGCTVNVPLPSGAGDSTFSAISREIILPVLEVFSPDVLLVSLGTDAHYRDPLASLALSSGGYTRICGELMDFARKECAGRCAFMMEGGYDVDVLAEIWAHIIGLAGGVDVPLQFTENRDPETRGRGAIDAARETHASRWGI